MGTNLKKLLIAVSAVAVSGFLVFGSAFTSYVSTASSNAKKLVKSKVPIEFEITRVRDLISNLQPEVKKNLQQIAEEEQRLAKTEVEIDNLKSRLTKSEKEIKILNSDLKDSPSKVSFVYTNKAYTRSQVETDLDQRFDNYRKDEIVLNALESARIKLQESLSKSKAKLGTFNAQKKTLALEIEQLQARLRAVEITKTTSEFNFDDGNLGKAKEIIAELKSRLEVEERLLSPDYTGDNKVDITESENKDIVARVSDYFDNKSTKVAEVTIQD